MSSYRKISGEIRIGVSACLVGERVRHDGGHKRDCFLTDTLSRFARLVPVCPEMEIGLGTPREPIHIRRVQGRLRLVGVRTGRDHTAAMREYAARRMRQLSTLGLSGYVLKAGSPSCGMTRVPVHSANGRRIASRSGLFAEELLARLAALPMEDEERLRNPTLRNNFIERVFAYRRLRAVFIGSWRVADLLRFHERERLMLLAHDRSAYRALRALLSVAPRDERVALADRYSARYMTALAQAATSMRHTVVLRHMARILKRSLDENSHFELERMIDEYRRGTVPLSLPRTRIRQHAEAHSIAELKGQSYLEPDPRELALEDPV
jgi:uncharacterized protein YbbK (DUF523 family)/uncharacterized protein YbgA (DUF1722 family)